MPNLSFGLLGDLFIWGLMPNHYIEGFSFVTNLSKYRGLAAQPFYTELSDQLFFWELGFYRGIGHQHLYRGFSAKTFYSELCDQPSYRGLASQPFYRGPGIPDMRIVPVGSSGTMWGFFWFLKMTGGNWSFGVILTMFLTFYIALLSSLSFLSMKKKYPQGHQKYQ